MNDINLAVDRSIVIWNETDPGRRCDLIDWTWTKDVGYLDPMVGGEGHDGIDATVASVQEQFPGPGSGGRAGPMPTTTGCGSGGSWSARRERLRR